MNQEKQELGLISAMIGANTVLRRFFHPKRGHRLSLAAVFTFLARCNANVMFQSFFF